MTLELLRKILMLEMPTRVMMLRASHLTGSNRNCAMPELEVPLEEHVLRDKNAAREAELQADVKLKDPHGP